MALGSNSVAYVLVYTSLFSWHKSFFLAFCHSALTIMCFVVHEQPVGVLLVHSACGTIFLLVTSAVVALPSSGSLLLE